MPGGGELEMDDEDYAKIVGLLVGHLTDVIETKLDAGLGPIQSDIQNIRDTMFCKEHDRSIARLQEWKEAQEKQGKVDREVRRDWRSWALGIGMLVLAGLTFMNTVGIFKYMTK